MSERTEGLCAWPWLDRQIIYRGRIAILVVFWKACVVSFRDIMVTIQIAFNISLTHKNVLALKAQGLGISLIQDQVSACQATLIPDRQRK